MAAVGNLRWHVARSPGLAWLETGLKLGVFGVLGLMVARFSPLEGAPLGGGERGALLFIQSVLCLGLLVAIYDRYLDREGVAAVSVLLNNLVHLLAVVLLLQGSPPPAISRRVRRFDAPG